MGVMESMKVVFNFTKEKQLLHDNTGIAARNEELVAKFIEWPLTRVREALASLHATGEVEIEQMGKLFSFKMIFYDPNP